MGDRIIHGATSTELSRKDTEKTLLHTILTRRVIGALFDVFRELGYGYQEKYYQRALAKRFSELGLKYVREQMLPLKFHQQIIGRYFVDFVVDGRLVVELKVSSGFFEANVNQVLGYLKASGLDLGLLAIFTPQGVKVRRIIETKNSVPFRDNSMEVAHLETI